MIDRRTFALSGLSFAALAACGGPPPLVEPSPTNVLALSRAIRSLGPGVVPAEADRAARIAYAHTAVLAEQYEIEDPPLVHNTKVNMGLKPRGLCWHWAEDMEARLAEENFESLSLHRAIANADRAFRIDHSTVIVSAKGADMFDGLVLDPWRYGGKLYWGGVRADTRYAWRPRRDVLEWKRLKLLAERGISPR